MDDRLKSFEDLKCWQEAHKLVLLVYRITEDFPSKEQFGLTSQMRRCTLSVGSNIAEVFARQSRPEKKQFYTISRGSLAELKNQSLVARDIGYIKDPENFNRLTDQISLTYRLLHGLIKVTDSK